MKFSKKLILILALIMTLSVSASMAQPADLKVLSETLSYSRLTSIKHISMGTASAVTWLDNTATNTNGTFFGVTSGITYPFMLVMENASTTPVVRMDIYETASTAGLIHIPTATCPAVPFDATTRQWSKIFTGTPNIIFTPNVAATVTYSIWTRP